MTVLGWVLSGALAVAYLGAGGTKLAMSYEKLGENPRMAWTRDFSPTQVKGIATVEVLGAIGVILPWLTGIARVLTPLAAVGLAIVQVGAMVVHIRRGEREGLPVNAALLVLAAVVAVIRFTQL